MHDQGARRRLRGLTAVAITAVAAMALTACTSGTSTGGTGGTTAPAGSKGSGSNSGSTSSGAPTTPATSAPATPAIITSSVVRSTKVSPTAPVTVSIAHGTLTNVIMKNAAGKAVTGAISADGTSWHNTEDLGYGKTYTIAAAGKNVAGTPVVKHETVTTVTPDNQTAVTMDRMGDYPLGDKQTYGVGIVPELYFDEEIVSPKDKAAVVKAIKVTTTPHVDGVWAWQDNTRLLFRPEHYWPSGTKVKIEANIYGVEVGKGLYGQADNSASFTIGRKQETIAYDSSPKVDKVYVYNAAGKVIKTMNTAMGQHGGVQVGSSYINFYTMDGTYTVLGHEQPAKMCSASYGLPANAPGGYPCEDIYNATKISTDGIYLHYLNTEYDQNNGFDVSHGCLNLNQSNSLWFFNHSIPGDPVVIHGNKNAPKITINQGGAWSVPWSKWQTGDLS